MHPDVEPDTEVGTYQDCDIVEEQKPAVEECPKAGITKIARPLHSLMSACWSSGDIPQEFKDAKITILYKQKRERRQ